MSLVAASIQRRSQMSQASQGICLCAVSPLEFVLVLLPAQD